MTDLRPIRVISPDHDGEHVVLVPTKVEPARPILSERNAAALMLLIFVVGLLATWSVR